MTIWSMAKMTNRQYNMKLYDKKREFGDSGVEIVRHVINADGITFSRKKTNFVLNFMCSLLRRSS